MLLPTGFNPPTDLPLVLRGSSISSCSPATDDATVSTFYQAEDGRVIQAYTTVSPAPPVFGFDLTPTFKYRVVAAAGQVPLGTKFRAVYNDASAVGAILSLGTGPLVYYQLDGSPGVAYIHVTDDGATVNRGVLAG
jgi:hypothetical protein